MTRRLFNISREGHSNTSLSNLGQFLLPSEWKSVLWCSDGTSHVSACLVPSLGTTGKSLALSPLHPPFMYPLSLIRFPRTFSSSRLDCPSCLSLSSSKRYSCPFITFMLLHWTLSSMPTSLLYLRPQNWSQHSRCGITWGEGKDHFPKPAGNTLLNAAQDTSSLHRGKGTFLAHGLCEASQILFWSTPFQPDGP